MHIYYDSVKKVQFRLAVLGINWYVMYHRVITTNAIALNDCLSHTMAVNGDAWFLCTVETTYGAPITSLRT